MLKTFKYHLKHPLTKSQLFQALVRYFIWQIRTRLNNKPKPVPLGPKSFVFAFRGMNGGAGNFFYRLHEFHEMAFLLHFLRPEDTFYDIGANIGIYSILASKDVGAKSISFEPVDSTFSLLIQNIALNNVEDLVNPLNFALGNENTQLQMTSNQGAMNQIVKSSSNETLETIEVKRLDDLSLSMETISYFKIDTEGFEDEVLRGAKRFIANKNLKVIQMEINSRSTDFGTSRSSTIDFLTESGFSAYTYNALTKSLIPLADSNGKTDALFIRELEFVKSRILNSKKVRIRTLEF